jgi:hypothetical protein
VVVDCAVPSVRLRRMRPNPNCHHDQEQPAPGRRHVTICPSRHEARFRMHRQQPPTLAHRGLEVTSKPARPLQASTELWDTASFRSSAAALRLPPMHCSQTRIVGARNRLGRIQRVASAEEARSKSAGADGGETRHVEKRSPLPSGCARVVLASMPRDPPRLIQHI